MMLFFACHLKYIKVTAREARMGLDDIRILDDISSQSYAFVVVIAQSSSS